MKVAVIGCGHLGTYHARLYSDSAEADLAWVMDIVPDRARELGESLGTRWTTDLEDALDGVEAVSVATPTVTHREVAGRCLERGVSVLVEKPITQTVDEGRELVELAAKQGRVLAVGHVERFNPAFRTALPELTEPRFIESHRLAPFVARSLDVDVVLDLMIHDLDLVLNLVREPIDSIDAVGVPVLTPGEDIANARLRFANGAVANLTASRVSREKVRKIRFFGPRRYHSLDLLEQQVERAVLRSQAQSAGSDEPDGRSGPGEPGGAGGREGTDRSGGTTESQDVSTDPTTLAAGLAKRALARVEPPRPADLIPDPAAATPPSAHPAQDAMVLASYLASQRLELRYGSVPVPAGNALADELRDFLQAVRGGTLHGASGADGLRNLELAEEIRSKVRQSLARMGVGSESVPSGTSSPGAPR